MLNEFFYGFGGAEEQQGHFQFQNGDAFRVVPGRRERRK